MQFNQGFDQQQQQYYQQPPPPKKSKARYFIGCGIFSCLGLVACFGIAFVLSEQEIKETEEAYGKTIINMCNPIRGGEADLANLGEDIEYPLRVVIFEEEAKTTHLWQDKLPAEWQADDKDAVDAVICIQEKEDKVIEECPYEDVDTGEALGTVRRVQKQSDIIVFSPDGKLVAELEALGEMPGECEDGERFRNEKEVKTKSGDDIEYADFEDAIRPIVLGEE